MTIRQLLEKQLAESTDGYVTHCLTHFLEYHPAKEGTSLSIEIARLWPADVIVRIRVWNSVEPVGVYNFDLDKVPLIVKNLREHGTLDANFEVMKNDIRAEANDQIEIIRKKLYP